MNEPQDTDCQSRHEPLFDLMERLTQEIQADRAVDLESYIKRYPHYQSELRQLWFTLRTLADLNSPTANADPGKQQPTIEVELVKSLGDFRIIREIGRGGMGIVYEAEQLSLGRRVALKILPFAGMLDERQLRRFQNEARASAMLRHPHIVNVHFVGTDRGVHYYAMDLTDGPSLAEVIEQLHPEVDLAAGDRTEMGSASPPLNRSSSENTNAVAELSTQRSSDQKAFCRSVARLGIQAAEALEYAHQHGVVHRDVKPSNLLLGPDGNLCITDFGLASTNSETNLTMTGDLVGTLRYMSPEQASGRRSAVDHRTDIYSLGVTLYELLTGQPAFTGDNRQEVLRKIDQREPPSPRSLERTIAKDLETIVLKAMSKDIDRRYDSAQAMADDLNRFLENRPIMARRSGRVEQLKRSMYRNPITALLCLASGLLLLTLGIAGPAMALRERKLSRDLQLQLYVADMGNAYQAWEDSNLVRVRELIEKYSDHSHFCGFEWHYLRTQLRLLDATPTFSHPSRVRALACSPNQRLLASGCEDGTVKLWDLEPGEPRLIRTIREHSETVTSLAFSPDSKMLAIGCRDRSISLWNVDQARVKTKLDFWDGDVMSVAYSPDGQRLAAAGGMLTMERSFGIVKIWDLATSDLVRELSGHTSAVTSISYSHDGLLLATGSADHTVRLWDPDTGVFIRSLRHSHQVNVVAFSPNGATLAAATYDFQINLWDTSTWTLRRKLRERGHSIRDLAFSPDSQVLASAGRDNLVKLWDVATEKQPENLVGHLDDVGAVTFAHDGTVISGSHDKTMKLWTIDRYRRDNRTFASGTAKTEIDFSPDGTILATTASLWEVPTPGEIHVLHMKTRQHDVLNRERFAPRAVACNGRVVAVGGRDLSRARAIVHLWDIPSSAWLKPLIGDDGAVESLAFEPEGKMLAASEGGEIKLWDIETRASQSLPTGASVVATLEFSPQGSLLAAGVGTSMHEANSGDRWQNVDLQLWNLQSKTRSVLSGHTNIVLGLSFSPDGSLLASGGQDKTIKLWKLKKQRRGRENSVKPYMSILTQLWVMAVAFSPDGKTLASGGMDGSIKLWNVATGAELTTLARPVPVVSLAFSPDGKTLAAGDADKSVKLFHASQERRNWPARVP